MSYIAKMVKISSPDYPQMLRNNLVSTRYSRIWTIGNLDILPNKTFVAHASEACQTEQFCTEIIKLGKQIHAF